MAEPASSSSNNSKIASSSSHLSFPSRAVTSDTINDDVSNEVESEKRLWVGNLDPKLTEFHLLKLVQKYGPIHHFDFLFHRSGPNIGLPRGYAFVEFEDEESASKCMASMDGKYLLGRRVVVRWAHLAVKEYPDEQAKMIARLPALGSSESQGPPICKDKAINAIEAKLRAMEREKKDQNLNFGQGSNKPGTSTARYPYANSEAAAAANVFKPNTNPSYRPYHNQYRDRQQRPYDRNRKPYSR